MKKFLYVLTSLILVSGMAFADFTGPSDYKINPGFQGNMSYSISPVKSVLQMYDNQIAIVKGNIIKRLSEDKYLFKDKTGEIIVEIDYKYCTGIQVSDKDTVELIGKIDKDFNSTILDVFVIKKIK